MEILNLQILRGPNYWSNTHTRLMVIKLDLLHYETHQSNSIQGFTQALEKLLPSLATHPCTDNGAGGFLKRLQEGAPLSYVIEHLAQELQCLVGMKCSFGRTRALGKKGIYQIVFSYEIEQAGYYAAKTAISIVECLALGKPYLSLEKDLQHLKEIIAAEQPGPSTLSILKEAEKRNIPYYHLNEESLIRLGQGANQRLLSATITSQTSSIGVDNACDKERTKEILASQLIPVPQGCIVRNQQALDKAIDRIGFPCVIKPIDGNHGRGITTNINSLEKAYEAFDSAKKLSSSVIVEKYITGQDFRFLVINYKLIAVAKRVPAMIVGTGNHTVEELIAKVNQDPHRGEHHENYLTTIKIDQHTLSLLTEQGFSLNCIVPSGQILYLKQTANISTGGTSIDVTAQIHPYNVFLAERIARLMHLDICGIDVIAEDIRLPLNETKGAVLEVNAAPGLRMHLCPDKGIARNVAAPIIDMLYPNNQPSRIPIIAATGLKFNRALIRLISALACEYGYSAGSTSAEGTYIGRHKIPHKQDSSFRQINMVLRDPIVDFGVFECSAEDILEHGLAFDHCDIGIVMNVNEVAPETSDPLYSKDLVHVKEVILRSVTQQGYCILNADVDLVYGMRTVANCNLALFSLRANNPRIIEHCQKNGMAAFVDHQHLLVCKGEKIYCRIALAGLSAMMEIQSSMVQNLLAAILACACCGLDLDYIGEKVAKILEVMQKRSSTLEVA